MRASSHLLFSFSITFKIGDAFFGAAPLLGFTLVTFTFAGVFERARDDAIFLLESEGLADFFAEPEHPRTKKHGNRRGIVR